jgi:hypothetical protein
MQREGTTGIEGLERGAERRGQMQVGMSRNSIVEEVMNGKKLCFIRRLISTPLFSQFILYDCKTWSFYQQPHLSGC